MTDLAATVLTLTPQQRSQVNAALQQVQAEVSKWAWAHVERTEPQGNEVANYSLPRDKELMQRMRDYLTTAIADAVGGERTRVFLNPHASKWVRDITGFSTSPELIVKRYVDEDGQEWFGIPDRIGRAPQWELSLQRDFPEVLRSIFPNGWADLAAREGFTLPEKSHRRSALP